MSEGTPLLLRLETEFTTSGVKMREWEGEGGWGRGNRLVEGRGWTAVGYDIVAGSLFRASVLCSVPG